MSEMGRPQVQPCQGQAAGQGLPCWEGTLLPFPGCCQPSVQSSRRIPGTNGLYTSSREVSEPVSLHE